MSTLFWAFVKCFQPGLVFLKSGVGVRVKPWCSNCFPASEWSPAAYRSIRLLAPKKKKDF